MASACKSSVCDRGSPNLIVPIVLSLLDCAQDVVVDDIECTFRSRLVLTLRGQVGVVIGSSTVFDNFIGFT